MGGTAETLDAGSVTTFGGVVVGCPIGFGPSEVGMWVLGLAAALAGNPGLSSGERGAVVGASATAGAAIGAVGGAVAISVPALAVCFGAHERCRPMFEIGAGAGLLVGTSTAVGLVSRSTNGAMGQHLLLGLVPGVAGIGSYAAARHACRDACFSGEEFIAAGGAVALTGFVIGVAQGPVSGHGDGRAVLGFTLF